MKKRWPATVAVFLTLAFAERADAQRCCVAACQQPAASCQPPAGEARGAGCTAACPELQPPLRMRRGAAAKSEGPAAPPPRAQTVGGRVRGNARQRLGGPGQQGGFRARACVDVVPPSCSTAATPSVLSPEAVALLQDTLAEEYYARDFYLAAAKRFADRRFANLARAEQNHVDALSRLVRTADAEPVLDAGRTVEMPDDLAQAQQRAEALERQMIAAYDVLLALDTNPPARAAFERIQAANRRHLVAAGR